MTPECVCEVLAI